MFERHRVALALSGGNALGAYQAGAYQSLHEAGLLPDHVAGASVGAVNGALIAGSAPEDRVAALRAFWAPAAGSPWDAWTDAWRRTAAVASAMTGGRADLLVPRPPVGWGDEPPSLFDHRPLGRTLARAVDWERLNAGAPRFTVTAVDLESGDDVAWDTGSTRITPDHVRASAALLPAFPPVAIEGRLHVDAGLSANLPLDAVLADPGPEPLIVIALDLLPLAGAPPATLGEAATRAQDLIFAAQSRRAIAAWTRVYALTPDPPAVTLLHLAYADPGREVAGKAFDFSPESVGERWDRGLADATEAITALRAGAIPLGRPGLSVHRHPG